jgi:hypothetical protein
MQKRVEYIVVSQDPERDIETWTEEAAGLDRKEALILAVECKTSNPDLTVQVWRETSVITVVKKF